MCADFAHNGVEAPSAVSFDESEPIPAVAVAKTTPVAEAPKPDPVPVAQTFEALRNVIAEFLVCSEHQRTILALWIVHTYCFGPFPYTPYLNIYSPEKQSGKTVCLQVLRYLANNTWMPGGGLTASRIMERIARDRPTLLLDDWQTAFRPAETQAIIGFLNASGVRNSQYAVRSAGRSEDKDIHCPKVFAGSATLPAPLADRSIPILLQRSEAAMPMWQVTIIERAKPLVEQILRWTKDDDVRHALINHGCDAAVVHSRFSFRQRELTVPLLAIADAIGGKWPKKARLALYRAFDIYAGDDFSTAVQVLADIRTFCAERNDPKKILTAELLLFFNALKGRAWSRDRKGTPLTPRSLRKVLKGFGVRATSSQRVGSNTWKGLRFQCLVDSWQRYLPLPWENPVEWMKAIQDAATQAPESGTQVLESGTKVTESGTIIAESGTNTAESGTNLQGISDISNVLNECSHE